MQCIVWGGLPLRALDKVCGSLTRSKVLQTASLWSAAADVAQMLLCPQCFDSTSLLLHVVVIWARASLLRISIQGMAQSLPPMT
jgi:hypothetical protein